MATSYTLKFSDPSKINQITVTGPVKNNYDTSLDLVGPGYVAYGQSIAQDFLKLLENFASPNAPANPIEGQLWYDTSNPGRKVLRINNGEATSARWPSATGIYQQANDPSVQYNQNLIDGDMWVDTGNTQLKIRYGNSWTLVGPSVSTGDAKTGSESVNLASNTGENYPVILNWVNGQVVEIISYNSFTPRTVIDGFASLNPGINLTTNLAAHFNGLADKAKALEVSNGVYIQASEVLKNVVPGLTRQLHNGSLIVQSPLGLFIKRQDGKEIQIYTTSSGAVINYENNNSALKIGINTKSYIKFNAANGNIGINTSTIENVALSVNGQATFKDNIIVKSSNTASVGLNLDGSASIKGSASVLGSLIVNGITTITNSLTVGNIIPSNLIRSIGTAEAPFERVFVKNIGSSTTYVKIFGSVTTATSLETARSFQIIGHSTSTLVYFNGTTSTTFNTTLTRNAIASPVGGVTTSTTATQTLLVLNTGTANANLQSIAKKDFLADVYPGLITTGMIIPSGSITSPTGYLLCNGNAYLQNVYQALFTAIGTRYGVIGAGTFCVPNLINVTTSTNTTASTIVSIYYHIKI
jgi:hypothetical protein